MVRDRPEEVRICSRSIEFVVSHKRANGRCCAPWRHLAPPQNFGRKRGIAEIDGQRSTQAATLVTISEIANLPYRIPREAAGAKAT